MSTGGWVGALAGAYALGTIPSADLAARLAGRRRAGGAVDLRAAGSGNPGAANAAQVLGSGWGVAVLVGDIAKAVLAGLLGWVAVGGDGACWGGTAAVVGHCLPVWNRFRGGKGVACSAGQCLVSFPAYFPIDVFVAYATAKWKRQAFTATIVASACWVLAAVLWWRAGWPNLWGPNPTAALPASASVSSAIILSKFAHARRVATQPERQNNQQAGRPTI